MSSSFFRKKAGLSGRASAVLTSFNIQGANGRTSEDAAHKLRLSDSDSHCLAAVAEILTHFLILILMRLAGRRPVEGDHVCQTAILIVGLVGNGPSLKDDLCPVRLQRNPAPNWLSPQ
jgi:hypothetical protein